MSEDLTHYDVLGVEISADKDAIRDAYQARLTEVQADVQREQAAKKPDQGSIDGYRREEASVRGAWQVLSDPYQRGRYDATIEMGGGVGEDAEADSEGADAEVEVADRRSGGRERRPRQPYERPPSMFSPEPLPTPASWPPGVQPPPSRARVLAMFIDMVVLMIIFVLYVVGRGYALEEKYPKIVNSLDRVTACTDRLDLAKDRDPLSLSQIQRVESFCVDRGEVKLASSSRRENFSKEERLDDAIDRADDKYRDLLGKTQGFQLLLLGVLLVAMLGYLVPSSVSSGKTLGKKLMQIRVVNADGSPLRLRGALVRYGLPVLVVLMLQSFGPIGFAVALFGVLTWPRSPNIQGLHDRMARTIVVDG